MNHAALDLCRAICGAHGALRMLLEHELGIRHGIDLPGFLLLDRLAASQDGRADQAVLAQALGLPRSSLVRQLLALEKTGIVARQGEGARREVVLRAPGQAIVRLARETVADLCTDTASLPLPALRTVLHEA